MSDDESVGGPVGIDIEVLAFDQQRVESMGAVWEAVPDEVDAYGLEQYLRDRFGPPTDIARTEHEELGPIQLGWFFDVAVLGPLGLPTEGTEPLVIPHFRFRDGSRRRLFEAEAEQLRLFRDLFGDNLTVVDHARRRDIQPESRSEPSES